MVRRKLPQMTGKAGETITADEKVKELMVLTAKQGAALLAIRSLSRHPFSGGTLLQALEAIHEIATNATK